jgi:hypothetical protein
MLNDVYYITYKVVSQEEKFPFDNYIKVYHKEYPSYDGTILYGIWKTPPQWRCGTECHATKEECTMLLNRLAVESNGTIYHVHYSEVGTYHQTETTTNLIVQDNMCVNDDPDDAYASDVGHTVSFYRHPNFDPFVAMDFDYLGGRTKLYKGEAFEELYSYICSSINWRPSYEHTVPITVERIDCIDEKDGTVTGTSIKYWDDSKQEYIFERGFQDEEEC